MIPEAVTLISGFNTLFAGEPAQYGSWVYILIFVVVLLASVFIITPVPANSLLFVSGAMAMNGQLSLGWVLASAVTAAYIGYDLNYWSARLLGLAVCRKGCPHIFKAGNIERTHALLTKYGPLSIIISRFIPVLNLPPFFAGLNSMDYRRYMLFNFLGAVAWCGVVLFIGYVMGGIEIIRKYLPLIFVLVILVLAITLIYGLGVLIKGLLRKNETISRPD